MHQPFDKITYKLIMDSLLQMAYLKQAHHHTLFLLQQLHNDHNQQMFQYDKLLPLNYTDLY